MRKIPGVSPIKLGDGTTVYQVRPMVHGKRLKARRFDTPEDAQSYLRSIDGKRLLPGAGETAAEFANRWIEDYPTVKSGPTRNQRKSDRTNEFNASQIKKFVAAYPDVRLTMFDRQMALDFKNRDPRAAIVMRNVFADAVDTGLIPSNPFARMNIERSRGRRDQRVLSEAQAITLADTALVVHGPEFGSVVRALILFSFYVGSRIEETCHVRWEDVNIADEEIHLPICKFDKPRTVVLLPEAIELLRNIPRTLGSDYIFHTKTGKQIGRSNHFWIWNPVRAAWLASLPEKEREQFKDLDWHTLRHSCGHHFYVTLEFTDEEAAAQLGHTNGQLIRNLYGHAKQDVLRRMKEKLRNRRAA